MPLMRASPGNWNPHLGNTTVWSINAQKNSVEYSQNGGRSWVMRCCNGSYGEFRDLLVYGRELLACTSKGLYVSTNEGRSFAPRCTNSSYGDFLNLQDSGTELLANTSKGLYYSRNEGRSWMRRWCCHTYKGHRDRYVSSLFRVNVPVPMILTQWTESDGAGLPGLHQRQANNRIVNTNINKWLIKDS